MFKCRNLAVRVVWTNVAHMVFRSTIGGHYKLVFTLVDDNDRSRSDLGLCCIRHKSEKHEYTFPHVALSTSNDSLLGFISDGDGDSSEQSIPCLGCSLLISQDGKNWYEVVGRNNT